MIPFPEEYDVARVAFAGDWHGNPGYAVRAIKYAAALDVQVIVHAGDFGFYQANRRFLDAVDAAARQANVIVVAIDGNHEEHPWLNSLPVHEDGVRRVRERVWHLPRGFRWNWMEVSFMALGGAYSVNRADLREGLDWWPEERLTLSEAYRAVAGGPVDVIITHDAPTGTRKPYDDDDWRVMPFTVEDLAAADLHRALIREVVNEVRPRFLWHGHYHKRYDDILAIAPGVETVIHGLDRDKGALENNVMAVDLVDLRPSPSWD